MPDDVMVLPDGSACGVLSFDLPKDHWIYTEGFNVPPMGMRCGVADDRRIYLENKIRAAAQYAVRCATMNGKEDDFDPDALVQQMVIGLLGYATPDGSSNEAWDQPDPLPPLFYSEEPKMTMKSYKVTFSDGSDTIVSADDACEAARVAVQGSIGDLPPNTAINTVTVQVQILEPVTVKVRLRQETRLIADECSMVEEGEGGKKTYRKYVPFVGYEGEPIPERDMPRW